MSNGLERGQHLASPRDIAGGVLVRRGAGEASLRHQQIGSDVLDPDHAKPVLFENAADPGQQMIVAAAEGGPDAPEHAKRAPVQPDLRQRRPHQRADENQVAAILRAKQLDRPADLADRNPVMAKARHRYRIASALQREQHRLDAARAHAIGDRERHRAAACDQADGG